MLTIKYYSSFKRDYKRIVKRGYDVRKLNEVITLLATGKPIPEKHKDHQLTGNLPVVESAILRRIGF